MRRTLLLVTLAAGILINGKHYQFAAPAGPRMPAPPDGGRP